MNLPTTIYAYDEAAPFSRGEELFRLEKGEALQRSIGDWLSVLGLDSLDEHNAVGALGRPTIDPETMEGNLPYRVTGAQVVLTFDYRSRNGKSAGNPSRGDLECHLTARLKGGWHSRGSEVHYTDQYNYTSGHDFPMYDPETGEIVKQVFHDRYKRGIRFNFEFTGLVGESNTAAILYWLTSLLIFLSVAETVVGFVVFHLLGFKSKVYNKSAKEKVVMAERGARAACQAIQAYDTFHKTATMNPGSGEMVITQEALATRLAQLPGVKSADASQLAAVVTTAFDEKQNGLNFEEWAHLTTEGSLSIKKWTEVGSELELHGEKLVGGPGDTVAKLRQRHAGGGSGSGGGPSSSGSRNAARVAPIVGEIDETTVPTAGIMELQPVHDVEHHTFKVTVPEGAAEGSVLEMDVGGKRVRTTVPSGAFPGMQLQFTV